MVLSTDGSDRLFALFPAVWIDPDK
jgi:hypothetical protein